MNKNMYKLVFGTAVFLFILAAVSVLSLCVGTASIPLSKVFSAVFAKTLCIERTILLDIRLPRIILAVAVGGGLSVAGVVFQAMFRNPLVEPYTLGVSGGAALFAAVFIVLGLGLLLPAAGFMGALTVILLVYFIASRKSSWNVQTVLLTGIMIGFISTSLIMLIMALSKTHQLREIVFWIMGSLQESNWSLIGVISLISILGMLVVLYFSGDLNAIVLGEEEALHLGINVEVVKKILFIIASVIAGCVVSVSGVIGFVGLVIPHFIRIIAGRDHRVLVPFCFIAGGIFLLISDTLARTVISPRELPVGVVTGIVGGIVFIYFLSQKKTI